MDSLHITSESDIFENVFYSCVVVRGRSRTNIDFWRGISLVEWIPNFVLPGRRSGFAFC